MGLLRLLGVVKPGRELELDIEETESLLSDTKQLEVKLTHAMQNIGKGPSEDVRIALEHIRDKDIQILKDLKELGDPDSYNLAKRVLDTVRQVLESFSTFPDEKYAGLLEQLRSMLKTLWEDELAEMNLEKRVLDDYLSLFRQSIITEKDIARFFDRHENYFGAKNRKKTAKHLRRTLEQKMHKTEILKKGPVVTDREVDSFRRCMESFFSSSSFRHVVPDTLHGDTIKAGVFGSLVTGYSSPLSKFRGMPSDHSRVSDVDIGIIVSAKFLKEMGFNEPDVVKSGFCFGPYTPHRASHAGPFANLPAFLVRLSFAGRTNRVINFVVMDEDFYRHNVASENHIIATTYTL